MDFVKSKSRKKITKKSSVPALILKGCAFFAFLIIGFVVYFLNAPSKGRTTIVLVGDTVSILSLENEKKTATVVTLPADLYLQATFGKGQVRSSSLIKLDNVSKKGGKLTISTIREFMGIPVDGWLRLNGKSPATKDEFIFLKENELSFLNFKSIFTPLYLRRFFYLLGQIREDKIDFINTSGSFIFQKESLPDGSEVLATDSNSLDSFLKEKFYDWEFLRENLTVSVLNGGGEAGMAARVSRILTNAGGHVIVVGESSTMTDRCVVVTSDKYKNSYTVDKTAKIFNCKIDTKNRLENSRADMIITIGLDYQNELFGVQ